MCPARAICNFLEELQELQVTLSPRACRGASGARSVLVSCRKADQTARLPFHQLALGGVLGLWGFTDKQTLGGRGAPLGIPQRARGARVCQALGCVCSCPRFLCHK